jgi:hypothetical protein
MIPLTEPHSPSDGAPESLSMTNFRALFSRSGQALAGIVDRIALVWWIALLVALLHLSVGTHG